MGLDKGRSSKTDCANIIFMIRTRRWAWLSVLTCIHGELSGQLRRCCTATEL